jgi:tetratricopeptide (TPR) repeat protein
LWFFIFLSISQVGGEESDLVQLVQQAEELAAKGQLGAAIAAYEKALAAGAGSARVLNRLAGFYLQTEELDRGAALLRRSLQESPAQPQVCFELAKVFQAVDQPDSALHYAQQALEFEPRSSALFTLIGAAHLQAQRPPEAKIAFEQALKLDASNPEAHRFLGVYFTELDSLSEAIGHFQQVAKLLPEDLEAHNNIAFLLARQHRYAEALVAYAQAEKRARDPRVRQAVRANREAVEALMAGKMRARYILVDTQAKAAEVLEKLKQGEEFAALAARFSKAANAQDGGDTGFFGTGELMGAFEKAVLQLEVGQTSQPLSLPLGVVIIQRLN